MNHFSFALKLSNMPLKYFLYVKDKNWYSFRVRAKLDGIQNHSSFVSKLSSVPLKIMLGTHFENIPLAPSRLLYFENGLDPN